MSWDSADDYEYAEGLITEYRAKVEAIRTLFEDVWRCGPGAGEPQHGAWVRLMDRLARATAAAVDLSTSYCRPTCGHRNWLIDHVNYDDCPKRNEDGDYIGCGWDGDYIECGCLCHQEVTAP